MTLTSAAAIDCLISTDLTRGYVTSDLDPATLGTPLSTITPKPITWLWPGRIPRGTLALLDGDPGLGTSLLALALAASVSSGTPLPDHTSITQGTVLLLSPHADPASTLVPRLSAAGADLSRIHFLHTLPLNPTPDIPSPTFTTRPFILPRDLSVLRALLLYHHPALVILDHLSALIPPMPLSRLARPTLPITDPCAADAPDLFTALAHLASTSDCSILLVRHTSRGRPLPARHGTTPVHLLLLPDPRAQDQRLLCTLKNTLSAPVPNQTYLIAPTAQNVPRLHWLAANHAPTQALTQAAYSTLSPNRQAILRTLEQAPGPLGPQDIASLTALSYTLARRLLARMAEANEIARFAYGSYTALDHPCLASRPPLHTSSFPLPPSETGDTPPSLSVSPSLATSPAEPLASANATLFASDNSCTPSHDTLDPLSRCLPTTLIAPPQPDSMEKSDGHSLAHSQAHIPITPISCHDISQLAPTSPHDQTSLITSVPPDPLPSPPAAHP